MGIMEPSILVHCITGRGFPLAVHLSRMLLPSCTEITLLAFNDGDISATRKSWDFFLHENANKIRDILHDII